MLMLSHNRISLPQTERISYITMDLLIDYIPIIFIKNTHNELSILILTITCFHFNNSKFCNSIIVNTYNTMYIALHKVKYYMHYPMFSSIIMIYVNDKILNIHNKFILKIKLSQIASITNFNNNNVSQ